MSGHINNRVRCQSYIILNCDIYILMTEIVFDAGVEGQLTYVRPLQCVNYHRSYCVHILCLIPLG